ncbi:unnamed protein product [Caenorhabditis sp. 36 PRJEB53466]|nr:unnamed protein product [Caenorhabditis sp. 36 PRJEB53466]
MRTKDRPSLNDVIINLYGQKYYTGKLQLAKTSTYFKNIVCIIVLLADKEKLMKLCSVHVCQAVKNRQKYADGPT